jgi:hypothetical protein
MGNSWVPDYTMTRVRGILSPNLAAKAYKVPTDNLEYGQAL